MAPKVLYDLSRLNLNDVEFGIEDIRKANAQRYEFEQLSGIIKYLREEKMIIGYRDVSADEFWVRGHIPGRPIFPGVLLIEAAAQLCSFFHVKYFEGDRFFGFGGIDRVKFRGTVVPGDRVLLLARAELLDPRRSIFATQGIVQDRLVFEAVITGIAIR